MAKKERHDNGSEEGGWREGSKTSLKTTGSGSASGRAASKEPVDRPCPRRGEGGAGASSGWRQSLASGSRWDTHGQRAWVLPLPR